MFFSFQTSGALSGNNQKLLTAKSPHNNKQQQQQEVKQVDAVNLGFSLNDDLSENLYTNAERKNINTFTGKMIEA